jgi:hypothetical protein
MNRQRAKVIDFLKTTGRYAAWPVRPVEMHPFALVCFPVFVFFRAIFLQQVCDRMEAPHVAFPNPVRRFFFRISCTVFFFSLTLTPLFVFVILSSFFMTATWYILKYARTATDGRPAKNHPDTLIKVKGGG